MRTQQMSKRRPTKPVYVGGVKVGGGADITVQSMTKTDTRDVAATVRQIHELEEAGCGGFFNASSVCAAVDDLVSCEISWLGADCTLELDRLFNTDWGRAVSAGFLISAAMFSIGVIYVIRNIFRVRSMALAGTPPTPEQAMRMQKQMRYGGMVALAFGIGAVLAMVMARGYNP